MARNGRGRHPGLLISGLSLGMTLSAFGAATGQTIDETIEVRVVNIDVYVSDKKGNPIEGLMAEDFELRVDGLPTPISNFYAQAGGSPAVPPREPAKPEPDTAIRALPDADPLLAVLYLDSFALSPPHRERVMDDLDAFAAASIEDGVHWMVVSYDPGLRVLTPFTGSVEEVRAALAEVAATPAQGFQALNTYRRAMDDITSFYKVYEDGCPGEDDPCDCTWHQMLATRDLYSAQTAGRQSRSREGLAEVVRALSGFPGRKALFYASSGLEQYPGLDLIQYLSDICPKYEREFQQTLWRWDDTSALDQLAASANANRVTLYPLDAAGVRSSDTSDVSNAEVKLRPSARVSEIRRRNLESSLFVLADLTGGRAILNANAPAQALRDVASDLFHYYSLGFQPEGPPDGRRHQIEVRFSGKRKGASLRFRQSFRDKTQQEQQVERTLTALHWGLETNSLDARVALGPLRESGRRYEVPVEIRLPEATITRVPGQPAHVLLTLAAHDLGHGRTDLREKSIDLPALEEGVSLHALSIEIELPKGDYRFAAGIRDEVSGVASYLGFASRVPVD